MAASKPDPSRTKQAIEIYLRIAYDGQPPPLNVRSMLTTLENWGGDYYACPVWSADIVKPPSRYSARLGNMYYPHMKLVLQMSPNDEQWLFRADAHDKHICPPVESPDYGAFCQLIEKNQKLVEKIESAWAAEGLPTFKTYLREDLARRAAVSPQQPAP